ALGRSRPSALPTKGASASARRVVLTQEMRPPGELLERGLTKTRLGRPGLGDMVREGELLERREPRSAQVRDLAHDLAEAQSRSVPRLAKLPAETKRGALPPDDVRHPRDESDEDEERDGDRPPP